MTVINNIVRQLSTNIMAAWSSASVVGRNNEVTRRGAGLVLRWVSTEIDDRAVIPFSYCMYSSITQASLDIPT